MYLVVGGHAQGKLAWVKEHFGIADSQIADGTVLPFDETGMNLNDCLVLDNLHELLRRAMEQNCSDTINEQLLQLPQQTVLICDEVGAGLVPTLQAERQWRELVGRTCCRLAVEAEQVWRIFCGLPQQLK